MAALFGRIAMPVVGAVHCIERADPRQIVREFLCAFQMSGVDNNPDKTFFETARATGFDDLGVAMYRPPYLRSPAAEPASASPWRCHR